jgi:hypothetical protein
VVCLLNPAARFPVDAIPSSVAAHSSTAPASSSTIPPRRC